MQLFIDKEIAKKQEKERMRSDRMRRKEGLKRKTLEEELDDDTKLEDTRLLILQTKCQNYSIFNENFLSGMSLSHFTSTGREM